MKMLSGGAKSVPPQEFLTLTLSMLSFQQFKCPYKFISPKVYAVDKQTSAVTLDLPGISEFGVMICPAPSVL